MMTTYIRPGGLWRDVPVEFESAVRRLLDYMPPRIDEYEALLTKNPLLLDRTVNIGILRKEDALSYGVTGPMLRASGVNWDLRKTQPYIGYEQYDFNVPVRPEGDTFARYMVRIAEMRESLKVIKQALDKLPLGPVNSDNRKYVPPPRSEIGTSMEALIHHFKLWTEGFKVPEGEVYVAIESPRGEIGCYIASDGSPTPYRMHIRAPSFVNIQALPHMLRGGLVADAVAVISSVDPILGEVDR